MKKFSIYFLALFAAFALNIAYSVDHSNAMMGGPGSGQNGGNWPKQGMMNGAPMMTNNGGFGMMNGMDAAPAVGTDGTVYVTTYNRVSKNKTLRSGSFKSTISAIGPSGQTTAFTMNGMVSRPVLSDTTLFATASLPDTNDFQMVGNYAGTAPQSVLYAVGLPFTSTSTAQAVSLDGRFASYKHYDFSNKGQAKSYLYIFNPDLTLVSKTEIQ